MSFVLAVVLCSFSNDFSTDLNCENIFAQTEDCAATLSQLKEEYRHKEQFVKMEMCIKKIKQPKIQTESQQPSTWKSPI